MLEGPPTALESSVFLCVGEKDLVFGNKLDRILSELAGDEEAMLFLVGVIKMEVGWVLPNVTCSSSVSSRHLTISLKARVSWSSSMLLVSVIVNSDDGCDGDIGDIRVDRNKIRNSKRDFWRMVCLFATLLLGRRYFGKVRLALQTRG